MENLINDKEWLEYQYVKNNLNAVKISNILNCPVHIVRKALKKHGIKIEIRSHKYKQLNDADWLYKKYVVEKLSIMKIAEIIGVKTSNSVRQSLIRHGIEVRSISEGLTINREDDGFLLNTPVIEGCLLGDGGFKSYNKESDSSYPFFYKKNKNYDHIKYIFDLLYIDNNYENIKEENSICNGRNCINFRLSTFTHKELMPLYRKWYPMENNYKKVIPNDVDISPISLLNWFMDDGCSTLRKGIDRKNRQVFITMCTDCFPKIQQEILCDRIYNEYKIKMNVRHSNSGGFGYRIMIPQSQVDAFYEVIGECPVESMQYKWK